MSFSGPRDAEDAGIRIIYQELNLVTEMTVAANIFLGSELTRGLGWLDDRAMEAEARRLFERLGTPINPARRDRQPADRRPADGRDRQGAGERGRDPDHG